MNCLRRLISKSKKAVTDLDNRQVGRFVGSKGEREAKQQQTRTDGI